MPATKPSHYYIERIACLKNPFHLVPVGNWPKSEACTEYFPTDEAALDEIHRRGAHLARNPYQSYPLNGSTLIHHV